MRKRRGDDTTCSAASDSAAARNVDPGGISTRFSSVVRSPHAHSTTMRLRKPQRMLKENRGSQRVNVTLASLGGSAQVAHGAQCRRARVPFVNITDGQPGPLLELRAERANLGRARSLLAVAVEW